MQYHLIVCKMVMQIKLLLLLLLLMMPQILAKHVNWIIEGQWNIFFQAGGGGD